MDAFVLVLFLLWKRCSSSTRKRITRTPKTNPMISAVLLFDNAVIVVVKAFVAVVTVVYAVGVVVEVVVVVAVGVDAFLQKLVMEAFLSTGQIAYCTELQRVQVAS